MMIASRSLAQAIAQTDGQGSSLRPLDDDERGNESGACISGLFPRNGNIQTTTVNRDWDNVETIDAENLARRRIAWFFHP